MIPRAGVVQDGLRSNNNRGDYAYQPYQSGADGHGWRDIVVDVLHGPNTKDELLVQYELWATFSMVALVCLDFLHCVGHATFGKLFLLMCSCLMLGCACIVADVEIIKRVNPAPGSPRVAFLLFWLIVARLCYLFPTSIIHAAQGDAVAWLDFLNVFVSGLTSIALFRAYQRLQRLEEDANTNSSPPAAGADIPSQGVYGAVNGP